VSIPAMLSVDIQLIKSWWLAACQLSAEMNIVQCQKVKIILSEKRSLNSDKISRWALGNPWCLIALSEIHNPCVHQKEG